MGVAKEPPPPNDMMLKFIKVWSDSSPIPKSGLDNNIVYRGDYGVGGSSKGFMAATTTDLMKACQAQGGDLSEITAARLASPVRRWGLCSFRGHEYANSCQLPRR